MWVQKNNGQMVNHSHLPELSGSHTCRCTTLKSSNMMWMQANSQINQTVLPAGAQLQLTT
jgi:hypothetical protein